MEIGPPLTRGPAHFLGPWSHGRGPPNLAQKNNSLVINIPSTFALKPFHFQEINPQSKIPHILSLKPWFLKSNYRSVHSPSILYISPSPCSKFLIQFIRTPGILQRSPLGEEIIWRWRSHPCRRWHPVGPLLTDPNPEWARSGAGAPLACALC
jgi:hypothetical protein